MDPNNKIVEKDLSYVLVGILFEIHTALGGGYQEKYYQRAVEELLQSKKIKHKRELSANLYLGDAVIGKFFLDFLVEDRVVLELKAKPMLHPDDFRQVRSYLKVNNLELGIIANFRGNKLVFKRILNRKVDPI